MPLSSSNTTDKFIVDRRRPHRNSDVARAIRRTRDRLAQQTGNPAQERELVKMHARTIISSFTAIPLLLMVITLAGITLGAGTGLLYWALGAALFYAVLGLIAYHIERMETSAVDLVSARRHLLAGHFVSGLAWVHLVAISCAECDPSFLPIAKAMLVVLAMAGTAILASFLSGALSVTFALPVAAYAALAVDLSEPDQIIMVGLLVVALPFFSYVSRHFSRSAALLMSFRAEMDALVAELETARSMSEEARRRAEDANLAKSRFLASMSHELRTPLNAILGFSEVMANEVLGPMQNETYRNYARDIHESGKHLLDLINEILDLSRIEAGRYRLNEEPVSLLSVVEECCHLMELKASNKDIRIVQQFEPVLPRLVGDERAMRQITLNLLSNAVKFTPAGGEVRVRVGWTAGGGQYLSVKDNGPGIPAEEIPIVLAAFGQGSITIKSAEQGTGLGLPIVQGLLALHGGDFRLDSKLREGTEAIAIFPPNRVMEELPAIPTTAAKAAGRR